MSGAVGFGVGALGGRTAFSAFAGESADFAFGIGWDMMVHGDSFGDAFTANLIGLGVGGVIGGVGGVIGRGLRSGGGDAIGDTVVRTVRRPNAQTSSAEGVVRLARRSDPNAGISLRQRRAWFSGHVSATSRTPISMDEALDRASAFLDPNIPIRSINKPPGVQFIQEFTDSQGNRIVRRVGFDVNPSSRHVRGFGGPHLNLQTQVNGRRITSGPLADPHIPIDPSTIRHGSSPDY